MNFYNYNGFLNIYKESGWTSMDVCAKLKGILGVRRIGHAGTLDPMAEGVLPVAVGRATKDVELAGNGIKEYRACMLLGTETDTEDITGTVLRRFDGVLPEESGITEAVMSFVGRYEQLTPKYSARKINGKKLYEYARAGIEVERKKKTVNIYSINIDYIDTPHVGFTVRCSGGTYIRTLCRDIGEKLGCGACMESLVRTMVGDFVIGDAIKLDEAARLKESGNLDKSFRILSPTAVAIGKFDGTHLGHQALLKELKRLADERRLKTCVIIFKFGSNTVLSDMETKRKLCDAGIEYCMEIPFTDEIKNMTAGDFLKKVLIGRFHMKAIAGGEDISFGKGREGNADFLKKHAVELGYEVHLIKKIRIDLEGGEKDAGAVLKESSGSAACGSGETLNCRPDADMPDTEVSSTLLRTELARGDMQRVARLLGAPYAISGTVVHGRHIGTDRLSTPTLNIEVPDSLILPPNGVYAVNVTVYDRRTGQETASGKGIANLGFAPTVSGAGAADEGGGLRLEAHVFDDIGDCYGRTARIELCCFIRPERRFDGIGELKTQVTDSDIPAAKKYFGIT